MSEEVIFQDFLRTMYPVEAIGPVWIESLALIGLIILLICIGGEIVKRYFQPKFLSVFKNRQIAGFGLIVFIILGLLSHGIRGVGYANTREKAFLEDPSDEKLLEYVKMVDTSIRNRNPKWRKDEIIRPEDN